MLPFLISNNKYGLEIGNNDDDEEQACTNSRKIAQECIRYKLYNVKDQLFKKVKGPHHTKSTTRKKKT